MSSYATNSGSPSRSNSNRREKIIVGSEPVVVKLDGAPDGIQREGQYGVDYQYFCNDDSATFYVPKSGRDAILRSGARKGDEIEVCKSRSGYSVILVSDAQEAPRALPAPAPRAVATTQPVQSPLEEVAFTALKMSAGVIQRAREHCLAIGLPEEYFEDVRSLAIHWLIARERRTGN